MLLRLQAGANVFVFWMVALLFVGSGIEQYVLAFSALFALSLSMLVWRGMRLPLIATWLAAIAAFFWSTREADWGMMDGGTMLAIAGLYLLAGLIGAALLPGGKRAKSDPAAETGSG